MIPLPDSAVGPVWHDSEPLQCMMVIPEAPDTCTFAFRPPSGARFVYKPGQFVTLELPVPSGTVHRTYTISSSPTHSLYLSITVKAQEGSVASRWMIDHLKPGMQINAKGPAGIFTLPDHPDEKYLFIGAGSGITPIMSMSNFLFESGEEPDIALINCARRPSELIFRRRFENMSSRIAGMRLHFVVSEEDPYQVWSGYRGRLSQIMLGLMVPDYLDRKIYCCGPEVFMNSVREILIALGYDMNNYHQESFHAPVESQSEAEEFDDFVPSLEAFAEIHFASSGITSKSPETYTILTAAKAAGLNIPSGCTFGVCGTCKIRKLSGNVNMVHSGGISDDDIEAGYILACCSTPRGKVEVEV